MSTTTATLAELPSLKGQELGTSDWVEVTQERVNLFADATGDHQWIHIDVERAKAESPFGGPIAHGYLTLSLLIPMWSEVLWSATRHGRQLRPQQGAVPGACAGGLEGAADARRSRTSRRSPAACS